MSHASAASTEVLARVVDVQDLWREKLADLRSDAAARRLCAELPGQPVLSALTAAQTLRVSRQAAANAINTLEQRGILVPLDSAVPGRNPRERWWQAVAILTLLGR